ncbi:MAG TPA: hypothetical protein VL738_18895 [Dactylosporangium sp.]|nr:hypothetical protein [Dactylosporangium sp.]
MHDPIGRALASMGADADRVVLADPATLRQIGSRRSRLRATAAVGAAVLAVLVGGYFAVGRPPVPQPMPLPPAQTAPSTPSGAPSASDLHEVPATPSTADPCDTEPAMCVPPGAPQERLPAPCTTMSNPSDAQITQRHSGDGLTYFDLDRQQGSTTFGETRTRYSGSGAATYLAEVRQAVARCTSVQRPRGGSGGLQTVRYRQVSANTLGGDESLLLSRTSVSDTYLIAVIRLGDVVVVVMDYGWEGSPSPRKTFDAIVDAAVDRARSWNWRH